MAIINGTSGFDTLQGGAGDDELHGLEGNDVLVGGAGHDLLLGEVGNDIFDGDVGNDTLSGGPGDDVFAFAGGSAAGDDLIQGGSGNDSMYDGSGHDTLFGGDGADYFQVAEVPGSSALAAGGTGSDTYYIGSFLVGFPYGDGVFNSQGGGNPFAHHDPFTVTDFEVGPGGDRIDVAAVLEMQAAYGIYAGGNPFAAGVLRLQQSGDHTLLQGFDPRPLGEWETLLTLADVLPSELTADNFVGSIPPNGDPVPGQLLTGTSGNDTLVGGFFNDTLDAGEGNDWLNGEPGDDLILGGDGDDVLVAGGGLDTINAGAGADTLDLSLVSLAVITGGPGQDYYFMGQVAGATSCIVTDFDVPSGDWIDLTEIVNRPADPFLFPGAYSGGNPFDPEIGILRLVQSGPDVLLQFDGNITDGDIGWETVLVLQNIQLGDLTTESFGGVPLDGSIGAGKLMTQHPYDGTLFDDTMVGLDNVEFGESLFAKSGDDLIYGGAGNDVVSGGIGNDTVYGGDGDDWFVGIFYLDELGDDLLFGGNGDDLFDRMGFVSNDTIDGGDGADRFQFIYFGDPLDSNKYIPNYVYSAHTLITGGAGRDVYDLAGSNQARSDVVTDFAAGLGGDLLNVNHPLGLSAENGGYTSGNPFSLGYLRLFQSGPDTLLQWDRDGNAGSGHDYITIVTLQNVTASAITSDNFVGELKVGTEGDDNLVTGLGNDTILGLGGNDTLDGSSGGDILEGGSGNDLYYVDDAGDEVIETDNNVPGGLVLPGWGSGAPHSVLAATLLDGITDTVIAAVNFSLENLDYVEIVTLEGDATQATGNSLANALNGNALANALTALDGEDTLNGGNGNDTLDGGADADVLYGNLHDDSLAGGLGEDTLYGGQQNDVADGGDGADRVEGNFGDDTLMGGAGNDAFMHGGQGNDWVYGNLNDDTLFGGVGDDTLYGGQQNDVADGGDGADRIEGNFGDDTLTGGIGNDGFLHGGQGNDWVYGNTEDDQLFGGLGDDNLYGGQHNDTLSGGDGNDNEQGNLGDDVMAGDAGNDTLHGGQGNDTLAGGIGNDSVVGGLGNDIFRYDAAGLNTTDVGANQADVIGATVGDTLSLLGLNDELTLNGTALSALTADLAVGNVLNATNNIAFTGGVLQIDLDGNDVFNALNDFQIAISGVTVVTYDADGGDVFRLS